ncbi:hypothetical protein B0H34DRAFT_801354 [Crassisporium funariophilum]|nr:hypothetical protein B0H34DRAFT_801354 [Crassisporium funariophilum]
MSSPLEQLSTDIFYHIAKQLDNSSSKDFQQLRATCKRFRIALSITEARHVYAHIFRSTFDQGALRRRYKDILIDSVLAVELVNRWRLLDRCRHEERSERISNVGLSRDLFTAMWMLIESDGQNEEQLLRAGFPSLIWDLYCKQPREPEADNDLNMIILWLLCLSLSSETIKKMKREERDQLRQWIYPYILRSFKEPKVHKWPCFTCDKRCTCTNKLSPIYLKETVPVFPEPSAAAWNLACVITYAHVSNTSLPVLRAAYPHLITYTRILSRQTTPLYADIKPRQVFKPRQVLDSEAPISNPGMAPGKSEKLDHEFGNLLMNIKSPGTASFACTPGTMTGLWEGFHGASSNDLYFLNL